MSGDSRDEPASNRAAEERLEGVARAVREHEAETTGGVSAPRAADDRLYRRTRKALGRGRSRGG